MTNAYRLWLGLAMVVAGLRPSLCLAEDAPPRNRDSKTSSPDHRFHPGWNPVLAKNGKVRRLTAKPAQWTANAMDDLDRIDSLEYLDLSGTSVRDEHLRALVRHASL
jgi:hypothetical protein